MNPLASSNASLLIHTDCVVALLSKYALLVDTIAPHDDAPPHSCDVTQHAALRGGVPHYGVPRGGVPRVGDDEPILPSTLDGPRYYIADDDTVPPRDGDGRDVQEQLSRIS